jgi:hypothetical protein
MGFELDESIYWTISPAETTDNYNTQITLTIRHKTWSSTSAYLNDVCLSKAR